MCGCVRVACVVHCIIFDPSTSLEYLITSPFNERVADACLQVIKIQKTITYQSKTP